MSDDLPRSVLRVKQALDAAGIAATVLQLPQSARTSAEAAHVIGCTVAQIAKSIVFRRRDTQSAVLALLRGIDRVDTTVLAEHLGTEIERATPQFVREATGFVIGGVPPLGHATAIEILVDEALMQFDLVWAAAGTPQAVFSADPRQLARHAAVLSIAERQPTRAL